MKKIGVLLGLMLFSFMLFACEGEEVETLIETDVLFEALEVGDLMGSGTLQDPLKVSVYLLEEMTLPISVLPASYEAKVDVYQGMMVDGAFYRLIPPTEIDFDFTGTTSSTLVFKATKLGQLFIVIVIDDTHSTYIEVTVERAPMNINFNEQLKVLAVGNSFSVDGMEYLYKIAEDAGVEEIILGNLYIGGASLQTHVTSYQNQSNNYIYYKNTDDQWTSRPSTSLSYGIEDEDWDIITIQQVSGNSGILNSYNEDLETLISIIETHQTNPHARIFWHMTWAYQSNSSHGDFAKYDRNQMMMYQGIVQAVQSRIIVHSDIQAVIPAGTAIQNLRTSYIGDTLTVDGYHLSHRHGRYTAGLTWFKAITGMSIDDITYAPQGVTAQDLEAIKEAVNHAIETPFQVTESTYTERDQANEDPTPPIDIKGDERLILDFTLGFWNSTNSHVLVTGDPISKNFISHEERLTKQDLPIGTIIIIEPGYQYRANFWTNLEGPTLGRRTDNITQSVIVVDEAWWGTQHYVAFNISAEGTPDISARHDEVQSMFHILLPYQTLDITFSSGFYNSLGSHIQVKTDAISPNFISPETRYSRSDIPVGSIIKIEAGYQYRANFWTSLDGPFTSNRRTDNLTIPYVVVDEAWWGNHNYVTFNVSQIGTPNISDQVDLVASKFQVILPIERKVALNFELGFYNSLGSHELIDGDVISKNFIATDVRFSKDQLPIGSILIIQAGYQYRANFWTTLDGGFDDNVRSDNITTFMVIIDEDWWGNQAYVSFNVTPISGGDLTDRIDEVKETFIIIR